MKSGPRKSSWSIDWLLSVFLGLLLTGLFWWPLWQGGGLIGGDLYPYYFPQKALLSDALQSGQFPLWNPNVGFGYPVLGESQTGAAYPPNLLLYSVFELNTAYNFSQLAHYLLAFVAMFAVGQRLEMRRSGALLAATAFVFGWFPPRICLEWAIIGGAWYAVVLWAGIVFLQTRARWVLGCGAFGLGLSLLAGHYNLAFISLLVLFTLPWLGITTTDSKSTPLVAATLRLRKSLPLLVMVGLGFLVAACQLLPTLELKSLSQRQQVGEAFSPTYGHLPPLAISQLWQPWAWHAADQPADALLSQAHWLSVPDATNQVEAFVYCGVLPLLLVVAGGVIPTLRRTDSGVRYWRWLILAAAGLIFATGWPTSFLAQVPGFGFFRGPGRYSLVTAFAISILAGVVIDRLLQLTIRTRSGCVIAMSILLGVLTADLWLVSRQYRVGSSPFLGRQVFYATVVDDPPIRYRDQSQIREFFNAFDDNVRVYSPAKNVLTVLGIPTLPTYLGLGPEIYESEEVRVDFTVRSPQEIDDAMNRLRRFGVTHLLLESPLEATAWPVRLIAPIHDPFVNRVFARAEPYYLYEISDALGRAYVDGHDDVDITVDSGINWVEVKIRSPEELPDARLVLTDLNYPGWSCSVGSPTEADATFREVRITLPANSEQIVRWQYRPWTVRLGGWFSLMGVVGCLLCCWSPRWLRRWGRERLQLR